MLIALNERSKWLQEFSNYNMAELKENVVMEVTRTASFITQNTLKRISLSLSPSFSVTSIISDDSTTAQMNRKIARF